MSVKLGLVGNPNSGKTSLFNELTGSTHYVGNWPGVTVDKKEGKIKGHKDTQLVDLPGIYAMSPYTPEERVSREFIMNDAPDALINIVDSTNLERNLYLTTQLLEMGTPVVIALNMSDLLEKSGATINAAELSKQLGVPVVFTAATKRKGIDELVHTASEAAAKKEYPNQVIKFEEDVESKIETITADISGQVPSHTTRWYAIKILENDHAAIGGLKLTAEQQKKYAQMRQELEAAKKNDIESIIAAERYSAVKKIVQATVNKKAAEGLSQTDKIDRIVTSKIWGFPIFAAIIFLVYYIAITTVGTMGTDWVNDVLFGEWVPGAAESLMESMGVADWMSALVLDGIIAGVGAVLGFLPQMMVLFFLLALLEDSGYMARVAYLMDKLFRSFGLSGKSFIPLLIGTGCSVPAIMASRTIENEKDRKITVITTSFIPCGAKLPVIALIAGALFSEAAWVGPAMYFLGVATVVLSAIILKKTKMLAGDSSAFIMELPDYQVPSLKGLLIHTWDRAKHFIYKAATIIFLASVIVWFTSNFNWGFQMVDAEESILAGIGRVVAPIFTPLGWGDWRATVAAVTGLIAKENIVGTFGVLYGFAEVSEEGVEIWGTLSEHFTQLSAMSFLIFNMICVPCMAAVGSINREMGGGKWTLIAVGFQTGLAYVLALIVYQLGLLFTGGGFGLWTVVALVALAGLVYFVVRPAPKPDEIASDSTTLKKIS